MCLIASDDLRVARIGWGGGVVHRGTSLFFCDCCCWFIIHHSSSRSPATVHHLAVGSHVLTVRRGSSPRIHIGEYGSLTALHWALHRHRLAIPRMLICNHRWSDTYHIHDDETPKHGRRTTTTTTGILKSMSSRNSARDST